MKNVKLIGAVVDTHRITLYKEDGTSLSFKQGTELVPLIVEKVIPEIQQNGYFIGDLTPPSEENQYKKYEEKSKVVKFFSIAKKKLAEIFSSTPTVAEPTEVGTTEFTVQKPDSGLDEVMKHAVSASDDSFDITKHVAKEVSMTEDNHINDQEDKEDTIVALVDGKLIPDAQRLSNYVKASNNLGSQEGLDNMLKRLATVVDERRHSVEDLMVFLERAELPISNDGRIIVYKALNTRDGVFVDAHTGRVKQEIGSLVETPIANVDPDRRRDCSNGLHLARRGYLSSFRCDTCVICYLDPVDVIAVPEGTGSKIRVTKYHILEELTPEMYSVLKSDKPITTASGGTEILGKAINNLYPAPSKHTLIKGSRGTDIVYSDLTDAPVNPLASNTSTSKAVTLEDVSSASNKELVTDPKSIEDTAKKPKAVTKPKKKVAKKSPSKTTKAKKAPKKPTTRDQIHSVLKGKKPTELSQKDIDLVVAIKKKAKKGWSVLGVSEDFVKVLTKK
jgi:hypothetical protein